MAARSVPVRAVPVVAALRRTPAEAGHRLEGGGATTSATWPQTIQNSLVQEGMAAVSGAAKAQQFQTEWRSGNLDRSRARPAAPIMVNQRWPASLRIRKTRG